MSQQIESVKMALQELGINASGELFNASVIAAYLGAEEEETRR